MSRVRNNLLLAATVGLLVGGCATTGGNLSSSANRLERSAYALQDEARDDDERSSFQRDARELAEEAREFRRVVEDRDSSDSDVQDAFGDVSRRYHAMRDEVDRSSSRDDEEEFQPVTDAYLDIERVMRARDGRRDRDRYASDD
jgi:predicted  nucleic acid-binding Zn-ribbon protein